MDAYGIIDPIGLLLVALLMLYPRKVIMNWAWWLVRGPAALRRVGRREMCLDCGGPPEPGEMYCADCGTSLPVAA